MKHEDVSEVLRTSEKKLGIEDIHSLVSAARTHDRNKKRSAIAGAFILAVGLASFNTLPSQSPANAAVFAPVSTYLDGKQRPILDESGIEEMFIPGSSATEISEAFLRQVLNLEVSDVTAISAPVNYEYIRLSAKSGEVIEARFFVGGNLEIPKLAIPRLLNAFNTGFLDDVHQDELSEFQSFSELQETMVKRLQAPLTRCPVTTMSLNKWDADGLKMFSSESVETNGYRNVSLGYDLERPGVGIALATCDGSFIAAQPVALLTPETAALDASLSYEGTVTQLSPEDTFSIKNYYDSFYRKFVPKNENSSLTGMPGMSVALYSGYGQISPKVRCHQFQKDQDANTQIALTDPRVVCALQGEDISQVIMEIRQGLVLELTNIWTVNAEFKISPKRWDAITSQIQVKVKK